MHPFVPLLRWAGLHVRVGLGTGSLAGGIVGDRFHVFGEALELATEMQTNGRPDWVLLSMQTMKHVGRSEGEGGGIVG